MTDVHGVRCDRCGKLADLVDGPLIELPFMDEGPGACRSKVAPPGWFEVRRQPPGGGEAEDSDFCSVPCIVGSLTSLPDDIPEAFRRLD